MTYRLSLDTQEFLQRYWQQQPVLIPGAFQDFVDPLEPDELAGLALEEGVASRIVIREGDAWRGESGPREEYDSLGSENWQLLVQAINHYLPEAQCLAQAFRFLPDWRFDDVMASFAVPGGGVGPHIDNYDVFIIQGRGERRWQVGDRGNYARRDNSQGLSLVEDFTPIIDAVMQPGDLLYIPPGYPHAGQTLSPSLSYSVGFRAPSQQELISALADTLLDQDLGQTRFTSQSEPKAPAQISQQHQQGMAELVHAMVDDASTWPTLLGTLLSQNRFELALWPPEQPLSLDELHTALQQGQALQRIGGLKVLQLEGDQQNRLFLDGQCWVLPEPLRPIASLLADEDCLNGAQLEPLLADGDSADALLQWVNAGYWYLD
ncbi:ribosomal protein uL16 3-hydroxylase [Ferrimonas marina]|uniref:50S ribosomal protein L16 3-hydroxylase n=1 Tax=Ferrimonas marina TaxID=299255 RepID=A0A1M5N1V8_9GAMM|nr:cupin domain-containing protein [Ferrimonas marina]SHG83521.1 50S ribosomal protein L16 3-hydroxylase [Ferrimonas marina]